MSLRIDGQEIPIAKDARVELDGMMMMPLADYDAMMGSKGVLPENHWPCGRCGAIGPTSDGHDPCIANLPGVIHACCGHGVAPSYVKFESGIIVRGHMEDSSRESQ